MFSTIIIIPIVVLGILSLILTTNYIEKQMESSNIQALHEVKETLDYLFVDIETLNITLSTNNTLIYTLKRILNDPENRISWESNLVLNTVTDFLIMKTATNPSIHSIYVLFENNANKFISSSERISDLNTHHDREWYALYQQHLEGGSAWSSPRQIMHYSFERKPANIVTVFHTVALMNSQYNGVVVGNISADYINNMLDELPVSPSHHYFIIDHFNNPLFYQDGFHDQGAFLLHTILEHADEDNLFNIVYNKEDYTVTKISSERTGLQYISAIPSKELYRLSEYIKYLIMIIVLISLFFVFYFSYRVAQNNYSNIHNILDTFEAAKDGKPLPLPSQHTADIYGIIISKIIRTFLQQDLMEIQLSEKKYQNQALELIALQAQMNPHFLYNTLGTIYWKVLSFTGKPNEASHLIENLSDIMRYSMHHQSATVPLEEEIQHTKSYISIQKVRYENKFDVVWHVDESLLDFHVLKLLIQPFVENSLMHGFRKDSHLIITIEIYKDETNQTIVISISDNGIGMTPEHLFKIKQKLRDSYTEGHHIGLFNTNKRIKLAYGELHCVSVDSKYLNGTTIEIRLPMNAKEQQSSN